MRALTSKDPTTRMATATVRADRTAISMDRERTGRPVERANSSSLVTENRAGANPTPRARIAAESTEMVVMSDQRTVEMEPNR